MKNDTTELVTNWLIILTYISVVVALLYGWVANIIVIWHTIDNPVTAKFILRCIGVFVPIVGSILGYL